MYFRCNWVILESDTRKGAIKSMIKRELYMSRIRPFIGSELIKVMTGIRRCGKSVMLELIKQELVESGVNPSQFISINFEDMSYSHLQTAKALHDEIKGRAAEIDGKVYLFLMKFKRLRIGRSVSIPCAFPLTAISTSPARMPSFCPVSWQPIWEDAMLSL